MIRLLDALGGPFRPGALNRPSDDTCRKLKKFSYIIDIIMSCTKQLQIWIHTMIIWLVPSVIMKYVFTNNVKWITIFTSVTWVSPAGHPEIVAVALTGQDGGTKLVLVCCILHRQQNLKYTQNNHKISENTLLILSVSFITMTWRLFLDVRLFTVFLPYKFHRI